MAFKAISLPPTAILDVLTSAYDQINNNEFSCFFVRFQKHLTLSVTLYSSLNITESMVLQTNFSPFFLSNQQQYIAHHTLRSKTTINRYSVLQGSNLGPLLFLI